MALHVEKLVDHFGQYELVLTCGACGHVRRMYPNMLANICGWEARLEDVARRLRCSKCGKRECRAKAVQVQKPRGYHAH